MTHALIAAKSGWGKGWLAQWWIEDNLDEYERVVVLDRRDEYRGLVKEGWLRWGAIGDQEARLGVDAWRRFIEHNKKVVLARAVRGEDWTRAVATIARASMELDGDVLVLIDEAHKVAPQKGDYPDAIEDLATEGRGRVATVWVTQRLAKLDETPIDEMMINLLGGFRSDATLRKIGGNIGYPRDVHKVGHGRVANLPDELHAPDEGPVSVRRWKEAGSVVGSEWIYSDDDGELRRINSGDLEMKSTHYGPESLTLSIPG